MFVRRSVLTIYRFAIYHLGIFSELRKKKSKKAPEGTLFY